MTINCNKNATKASLYNLESSPWNKEYLVITLITAKKVDFVNGNPGANAREFPYTGIARVYSFNMSTGPFDIKTNAKLIYEEGVHYESVIQPEFRVNINSYWCGKLLKDDNLAIKITFEPMDWFVDIKTAANIYTIAKDASIANLETNKDPHSFDLELIPARDRNFKQLATPIADKALKTIFNELLTDEDKFIIKKDLMEAISKEDE